MPDVHPNEPAALTLYECPKCGKVQSGGHGCLRCRALLGVDDWLPVRVFRRRASSTLPGWDEGYKQGYEDAFADALKWLRANGAPARECPGGYRDAADDLEAASSTKEVGGG